MSIKIQKDQVLITVALDLVGRKLTMPQAQELAENLIAYGEDILDDLTFLGDDAEIDSEPEPKPKAKPKKKPEPKKAEKAKKKGGK